MLCPGDCSCWPCIPVCNSKPSSGHMSSYLLPLPAQHFLLTVGYIPCSYTATKVDNELLSHNNKTPHSYSALYTAPKKMKGMSLAIVHTWYSRQKYSNYVSIALYHELNVYEVHVLKYKYNLEANFGKMHRAGYMTLTL